MTASRDAREVLDQSLSPLHDDHTLLERVLEVEVGEVERAGAGVAQAVGVDVQQRDGPAVAPGEHEGRAGDGALHAQPRREALGQRGLAGAERAR